MPHIYGLYDPSLQPRLIRYVGYTSNALKRRLIEHIAEAKRRKCHRHKWICSVLAKGVKPGIVELETVDAENCRERETHWIATLGGSHLINSTAGGEGLINPSADVRERISRAVSAKLSGTVPQGKAARCGLKEKHLRRSEGFRKEARRR